MYMSKYHTIVGIDPVGNQELDMLEFTQESRDAEQNVVYLYISGDRDIPSIYYEDLPACEHMVSDDYENCECGYSEHLVNRTIKYYTDLGFDVSVVSMRSFISPLG